MHPLELRTKIYNSLQEDTDVLAATLVSPIPGRPIELTIETPDTYGRQGAKRRFRVVIEEL